MYLFVYFLRWPRGTKGRKGRLLFAAITKIAFALLYKIYLGNILLTYVLYSLKKKAGKSMCWSLIARF